MCATKRVSNRFATTNRGLIESVKLHDEHRNPRNYAMGNKQGNQLILSALNIDGDQVKCGWQPSHNLVYTSKRHVHWNAADELSRAVAVGVERSPTVLGSEPIGMHDHLRNPFVLPLQEAGELWHGLEHFDSARSSCEHQIGEQSHMPPNVQNRR
jgi:hypothetical protein